MKFFAISDTHGLHRQVVLPVNVDCFLFAGDSTNSFYLNQNLQEFEDFFNWFVDLPIKHKIIIAGNHDTWATKAYVRDKLKEAGVIYLENEYHQIDRFKIFGSPWTPTFGTWHFMKDRSKMDAIWRNLDYDIDILITHGPPNSVLDLTENRDYKIEQAGDISLFKRVMERKPDYHIFGHIHNFKSCRNQGMMQLANHPTKFVNVSAVEDGQFSKGLISNGYVFELCY